MIQRGYYFSKAGRAGADDLLVRTPELRVLREKTVAVFGAGCLGAASVLEFARAGVAEVRVLDHDVVDPGTITRWPLGLSVAGRSKVAVLARFVSSNYPATKVVPVRHFLGGARNPEDKGRLADPDVVDAMTSEVSLIYDATAEIGLQYYLSEVARERDLPYLGVVGTFGGWGGKVVSILPGRTKGCWLCQRYAFDDGTIPEPPSDPSGEVQPYGCGDVTFTGAGFDMLLFALSGVRAAVSTLCRGAADGYPELGWDVTTIALRDENGRMIVPAFNGFDLERHPRCPRCREA